MAIAGKVLEKVRLLIVAFDVKLCIAGQIDPLPHSPVPEKTARVHLHSQIL
ncbi:hypothetical protein I8752_06275 [Nostocaceae cyanobacterium CENA369]|uniref:Uncharacterized protein n=1 Tax=Dendronalium phyllosphericum CENA369 TaxID=1725256 RepID=A0A8J7HYJ1_9NOST|nr:hypothetical protein [Dendronalium phyllosphericum]MBH8572625.1 hypothetical protein [Dendronalium phyllosphericum CENA369]